MSETLSVITYCLSMHSVCVCACVQKLMELEKEVAAVTESNQRLIDELHSRSERHDDNVSLQHTIHDLEEQLETLSRSERLAQQRIKQLEEEVRNLRNLEEV